MVDIVLVNPPLSGKERYGTLAGGGMYMPPIGLACLAAFLRQKGYSVKIIDCSALGLNTAISAERVISCNPKYVGISSVTISIHNAAALAKILKEKRPDLKIILGGCHISALPEETMTVFPHFDVGVIGEGELTVLELLGVLEKNDPLNKVKGIVFRENGALRVNESRPFIENLDTLPFPAWDLLPDITKFYRPSGFSFKKLPLTSLVTLRGCPMRCTFCSDGPFAKTIRTHSPEYVVEMIKFLTHNYNIKEIVFYDGTYVIDEQRLIKLCELMIREKLNLVWSCNGRIDLMKPKILRLMKKAGCWQIAYGIESGSQRILDFLKKGFSVEDAYQAIKWTKNEDILSKGYFMLGSPTEDEESLRSTLNFTLNSELELITVTYFTPLPGTLDYTRAGQYGNLKKDWYLLNLHNPVFIPRGLDIKTIYFYRHCILRRFYLRPKIILRFIKIIFNFRSMYLIYLGFLSFLNFMLLDNIIDEDKHR